MDGDNLNEIGVDVSGYQGLINWFAVKADGIKFAILKIIRKDLNPDKQFENNWQGCIKAGVPIKGVYNYTYATTVTKAISDAKKVLQILNGRKAKVYLDVEDKCLVGLGKTLVDIINAYAEVITSAGLEFGVYTGEYFYNKYIKPYGGITYPLWIARYGKNTGEIELEYQPQMQNVEGWQYTSKGDVVGIVGDVDMNVWYGDSAEENPEYAVEDKKEVKEMIVINAYSKAKDGDKKLSTNFKVKEFACKDGSDPIFIAPELVEILQKIRTHFGKAVTINSAYRTATYNKKVGGATYSQHCYGMAADIKVAGVAPKDVADYAETLLQNKGGIGRYPTFTHVDVREVKSRWNG